MLFQYQKHTNIEDFTDIGSLQKKYWHIYYYDEECRFHSEQVGFLKAMYYKNHLWYKRYFICEDCLRKFVALVKKKARTAECPNCE